MKYFTKYLECGGSLEVGDITFWEDEGYYHGKFLRVTESFKIHANASQWKKYKLFLCSREEYYGEPPIGTYIDTEILDRSSEHIIATRVIGEISPDATWVKPGDEFDESELCLLPTDMHGKVVYIPREPKPITGAELSQFTVIGVKGPCGHFH